MTTYFLSQHLPKPFETSLIRTLWLLEELQGFCRDVLRVSDPYRIGLSLYSALVTCVPQRRESYVDIIVGELDMPEMMDDEDYGVVEELQGKWVSKSDAPAKLYQIWSEFCSMVGEDHRRAARRVPVLSSRDAANTSTDEVTKSTHIPQSARATPKQRSKPTPTSEPSTARTSLAGGLDSAREISLPTPITSVSAPGTVRSEVKSPYLYVVEMRAEMKDGHVLSSVGPFPLKTLLERYPSLNYVLLGASQYGSVWRIVCGDVHLTLDNVIEPSLLKIDSGKMLEEYVVAYSSAAGEWQITLNRDEGIEPVQFSDMVSMRADMDPTHVLSEAGPHPLAVLFERYPSLKHECGYGRSCSHWYSITEDRDHSNTLYLTDDTQRYLLKIDSGNVVEEYVIGFDGQWQAALAVSVCK